MTKYCSVWVIFPFFPQFKRRKFSWKQFKLISTISDDFTRICEPKNISSNQFLSNFFSSRSRIFVKIMECNITAKMMRWCDFEGIISFDHCYWFNSIGYKYQFDVKSFQKHRNGENYQSCPSVLDARCDASSHVVFFSTSIMKVLVDKWLFIFFLSLPFKILSN